MTIKRRLAMSNVIMLLLPIVITLLMAAGCATGLWLYLVKGQGVGFDGGDEFRSGSFVIANLAKEALEEKGEQDKTKGLQRLSDNLNKDAMSMIVLKDGKAYYQYGAAVKKATKDSFLKAVDALGGSGVLTSRGCSLRAEIYSIDGKDYAVYIFGFEKDISYHTLKDVLVVIFIILVLTVLLSVIFTDRILTRFVWRHVEEPLDVLTNGVHEISEGNLDYRLEYHTKDEFLPVCEAFNGMAIRLKASVEQSRREEESRKEMMAGLSHDLRSPLTSIQAYVEGLLDDVAKTPAARQKYLRTIKGKAEELERMVERIMAISRLDMKETSGNPVRVRLDRCLEDMVADCAEDYKMRGLSVMLQTEPCTIKADTEELHQMLLNIADNSLKYKEKETGNLQISLKVSASECELRFADDGPGVPEEALPKLFDLFYRTNPARNDRAKGSGLGLAIVAKTVAQMNGEVHAENAEDGGLVIIMRFPTGGETNA